MIVTIDGPAGAGKSSVALKLAETLGFFFLDTGAMYRCITLACMQAQVDLEDPAATLDMAQCCQIDLAKGSVALNQIDVTRQIRTPAVAKSIKPIAENPEIRALMVQQQRRICAGQDCVTEGRDQGTVAFPDAECKIFLTATPEERARRRYQQLLDNGIDADYDEILRQQNQRDENDSNRLAGPLIAAPDAFVVGTDGMSEQQVHDKLLEIVRLRIVDNTSESVTK
jgi:cytidylate kinase